MSNSKYWVAAAAVALTGLAPAAAAPLNVTYSAFTPNASDNLGTLDLGTNVIQGQDSNTCISTVSVCGGPSALFQLTLPSDLAVDSVIFEVTRLSFRNADFQFGDISFSWKPYIQRVGLTAVGATGDLLASPVYGTSPLTGFNIGYTLSQITANTSYGLDFSWKLSLGVTEAPVAVPLPPTLALTALGLAMLAAVHRYRRRQPN